MVNFSLTANDIAPFFVKKKVSPLKLQKLLYYSQVWYVKKFDLKLFSDPIKAWVFGPVVPVIWNKFKIVRRSDIIAPIAHFYPCPTILPQNVLDHLEEIWNSYGHLSGSELVDLTHSEYPWNASRKGLLDTQPSDNEIIINNDTLAEYVLDRFNNIPYVKSSNSLGFFSS
ncbi:DUF4065 domain-containing protein [Sphingobacterium spiritivorum]|uniref:Antitoxin SocA-like Panacea domain-containing protein n=1 Tax=Sphingobacterium spiritivorum ATCC 33861 TaxID=525373 RepID=D7VN45_SPHSI|nr:type II toxin-antitoxin system antitoxin SocA domain-containing protein [Sphingobacterium spiritivorum]EFK57342.1 hypothetical protein HMPREF0766_12415 [Sphingobacterium spiritivorum ATCC 33861]QQT36578.1 DUF4065 domain-containing protein [Sphingobacterium spiritivorum]WQD33329.1 DUF4065 domain-containing protein [Sphingobacterium spiritivorum]SUJ22102.1 Uncharacterized phage-associated protein [Sphingobacterium spiritivorum]